MTDNKPETFEDKVWGTLFPTVGPAVARVIVEWHTTALEEADYAKRVQANVKLVANASLPGEYTDSWTGKKLYNEAGLEAAKREARKDVLNEYKQYKPGVCPSCYAVMTVWPSVQGVWTEMCRCQRVKLAELSHPNQPKQDGGGV